MRLEVAQLHITAQMKGGTFSTVVQNICLSVETGKRLAIVGQSGSGKTMTAMAILGLLPENCSALGHVVWNGIDILSLNARQRRSYLGTDFALIPQSGADFLNPSLKVGTQFREVLRRARIERSLQGTLMHRLLSGTGFDDPAQILRSYPFQLSGGMAQRVVMAMAAAGNPHLVIADEPTRGIDQENIRVFLANLNTLFKDSAILLITHDISVAAACDEILVMNDGHVIESAPARILLQHPKAKYTRRLICNLPTAYTSKKEALINDA
ncbi:ABC transporter ATP-binding protein [Murimonas intestini]|uniref:Nickel import system ATP-binding protein NikD n=1 Tax=Murimonas intestini TaxID=1337051 RepID=A0AB73T3R8_9FIRM|nr:ABC transporter ATP-binding protein [Murimonas intestini]MCR1841012.1 ABC transporter ATP-binding protein [Murimonas intestini]MCR1865870.1 ABC transporter ATP-binding protein [Murimonas intestini]MCR1883290.1 ABC transporter ATP-binding protein [Murimonas intestini]